MRCEIAKEFGAELRRNGILHEIVNALRCENANAVRNCESVLKVRIWWGIANAVRDCE